MKWQRSRINDKWMMTRIAGDAIAVREMKWYEKFFYCLTQFRRS